MPSTPMKSSKTKGINREYDCNNLSMLSSLVRKKQRGSFEMLFTSPETVAADFWFSFGFALKSPKHS